jgi:3'-5' exonuclease
MSSGVRNASAGSYLVLDLETVVDTSLPALPARDDGKDVFPPVPYHEIVVMGAALLDASYRVRRTWVVGEGKDERGMLVALTTFLNEQYAQRKAITVVGFNSRGFDMLVIAARCLRYGIAFPWYYAQRDVRFRYSATGHFDLMDFLVDHGASRAYGLDLAARLAGSCGKLDVHGGDVAAMIAAGKIEDVRAYCLSDVAQTVVLLLRVQLLRGELTAERYVEAMAGLLALIDREPRLTPLRPLLDRNRLLLREATVEPVELVELQVA